VTIGTSRTLRLAVIAVLVVAGFVVRANLEADPGPLFLVPTLLAGFWFGRVGGVAAGAISTVAFVLARKVNPDMLEGTFLAAGAYRLVAYTAAGYAFGWLVEDRRNLRAEVNLGQRNMAELRDLQEALAPPEMPTRPSLDLASCYVPAEGGAGGDFFLVAPGPRDATLVVVGDVAGKGLQAAKRAAYVRMGFAAAAPFQDNPCRLLELANTNLIERAGVSDIFVTAACFVLQPSEKKLTWALAGHPPPLLLADGRALNSVKASFPLGIGDEIDCELGEADLEPGEGFVAFTDGLTEARRRGGDLFGVERASELIAALRDSEPTVVIRALRTAAERYAGGPLTDDLCMVAVRARRPVSVAAA
jgi:serine phosphatase RsbU (regulator of sigma subunit)